MAGPVGLVKAMLSGNIEAVFTSLVVHESHMIQAKNAIQLALDTHSVETIVGLSHAWVVAPASCRANTSSVDAAKSSMAPT